MVTAPTVKSTQAPREKESVTPRTSSSTSASLMRRRSRKSLGVTMSSVRISAMGTRNGPKTFGSWKNAWTRPPLDQKIAARDADEEREGPERCGGHGREGVGARHETRRPERRDIAAEPDSEHDEIRGDRQVHRGAGRVDHFHGRQQVEREQRTERAEDDRRDGAAAEASGDRRHGDDDDEDNVGRGRLDQDDASERETEYHRRVEASDRECDDREERRTSDKLEAERSLGASQAESDRERKSARRYANQHELGHACRRPAPSSVSENPVHASCRAGRRE